VSTVLSVFGFSALPSCKRHPRELRALEVQQFLTHLAVAGRVSASTQNQALNALVFLYQQVRWHDQGQPSKYGVLGTGCQDTWTIGAAWFWADFFGIDKRCQAMSLVPF
jgi:hypothetical protein